MSDLGIVEVNPSEIGAASADIRYLYIIHEDGDEGCCKVGRARHPEWRRMELQAGNHRRLVLFKAWRVPRRQLAVYLETNVHSLLSRTGMRGEWFRVSPEEAAKTVERQISEWEVASIV